MDVKKNKLLFILSMFVITNCWMAFASPVETYPVVGGDQSNFNIGNTDSANPDYTKYDQSLLTDISHFYSLSDPTGMPLVADLDNDGTPEIIVQSADIILTFHYADNDLTLHESKSLDSSSLDGDFYSNMVTFDIDNDGKLEILIHSQLNAKVYSLGLNSTGLYIEQEWSKGSGEYVASPQSTSDSILGCGDKSCLLIYNDFNTFVASGGSGLRAYSFNTTHDVSTTIRNNVAGTHTYCLPRFGFVHYSNENNAFYFPTYQPSEDFRVYQIEISDTLTLTSDVWIASEQSLTTDGPDASCGGRGMDEMTSIVSGDFTDDDNNEIVLGYQVDEESFRMLSLSAVSTLDFISIYPGSNPSEGVLKSNPFFANVFEPKSETQTISLSDACVVGFDDSTQLINIMCTSERYKFAQPLLTAIDFQYNVNEEGYNITNSQLFSSVAHSMESNRNNKIDEVLTSYGVFQLEKYDDTRFSASCGVLGFCDMTLIYSNPIHEEGAFIMADAEGVGFPDLIGLLAGNLVYIDDGFVNREPYLGYCTKVEPSLDAACWDEGGRVRVTALPRDYDGDDVRARVFLFADETGTIGEGGSYTNATNYSSTEYPDAFEIALGSLNAGNYAYVYVSDDVDHVIDEDGNEQMSIIYNYTSFPNAQHQLNITMEAKFDGDNGEDLYFSIYNYTSGEYDDLSGSFAESGGETTQNFNYDLGGVTLSDKGWLQNEVFRLNISQLDDNDGGDKLELDYLEIKVFGSVESMGTPATNGTIGNQIDTGWSAWFDSKDNPQPSWTLTYNLTPQTTDSILRIVVQDDQHNDSNVSEDFYFDVDDIDECEDYFESNSCTGYTEQEYLDQIVLGLDSCTDSNDCQNGYTCINSSCTLIPTSCGSTNECPTGYVCFDNSCNALATADDNAIKEGVSTLSYTLGVPIAVLVLLIIIISIYTIFTANGVSGTIKFALVLLVPMFLLGIGWMLELISVVWLLLYVIVIVGIGSIFITNLFSGGGGN